MISVIIPTYNRISLLLRAIESINNQTYKNIEIIIVDDCSTDNTCSIIKKRYGSKINYYCNSDNRGSGFSRKFGFSVAHGDYIIFMDDDDYYIDNEWFSKAVSLFEKYQDDELAFVAAHSYIEQNGIRKESPLNYTGYIGKREYLLGFQTRYSKPHSTMTAIFSRDVLLKSDILMMNMVNDASIYLRALLNGDAYIATDYVATYVLHEGSISYNIKSDFLIKNLDEKYKICSYMKHQYSNQEIKKYWFNQVKLTSMYYICESKPLLREWNKVALYIIKKSFNQPSIYLIILYAYFKLLICK